MTPWMDLLLVLGTLNVLSGVSQAGPLPADTDDQKPADEPVKLPFSLELEPPLPDNVNAEGKPVVLPLRDSYGNPIPPAVLGVDPSGADYDLNAPNNNQNSNNNSKKAVSTQGINFPIPSYASGITEIHRPSDGLLPPFDSDHKPNKDGLATSNLPSVPVPLPVNDLLPPLSIPQTKDDAINEISGTLTNNTPIPDKLSSPALIASIPTASTAIPSATITTTPTTTTNAPVTTKKAFIAGKYTGGFGGAPGILGEQKKIGYDVSTTATVTTTTPAPTTTVSPTITTPPPTTTTPPLTTTTPPPTTTTPPSPTTTTTTTTTQPPPTTPSTTTTTPLPTPPSTTTTLPTTPQPTTTTTTASPPTPPPTTTTTPILFIPRNKEIVTRSPVDDGPTRIPIGVAPPGAINLGVPAISKVLLPPFESPQQGAQNSELYSSTSTTTTTTTTNAPRTTTTTTTTSPTTIATTTTSKTPVTEILPPNQPDVARIDLDSIPFPTTPPLEILIRSTTTPPKSNAIPTLATILLPPPYSSNSRPFQPPPPTPPTTVAATLLVPPPELPTGSREGGSFLSLSFGFPNTPTNESPQKTAIGKALQERFGSNFNVQQLPSFINSLQQGQSKPAVPAAPATAGTDPKVPLVPSFQGPSVGTVVGAPKPPATSDSGKYTGGFGGAPGILGDQKQVGYGIKPQSGTPAAAAPPAAVAPPAVAPPQAPVAVPPPKPPVAAPAPPPAPPAQSPSGEKYTGGFGGPPGILVPYDKKDS